MYKAIENIGDYKKGDIVPDDIAIVWAKMYLKSPVEKVGDDPDPEAKEPEVPKDNEGVPGNDGEGESKEESSDVMLDDYLARNQGVVLKNVADDDLSKKQLESLLELEKKGKKRSKVIKAIKFKIKRLA